MGMVRWERFEGSVRVADLDNGIVLPRRRLWQQDPEYFQLDPHLQVVATKMVAIQSIVDIAGT